ncbi:MAG: adenylyl-sulfate kinase [Candidatus Lloydbacteria bacterium RIFCSPHIGHO2_02_FULL_51_22]|uniref:Adenylyl-sulfate kinase n=2 Tax=Candidatus Lloydiibacteriota TaxID=1817910 RepID=A0A1G2DID9_9BACT|nr:MAG: adenylyl-sulfate kinase [Candidatus Lloydbacteria bacterium RIFCSPHIGHO2_02_FULL_51_22]OGZ17346.1 MAG: adenylyl-sulfate kinase [Candidatus Lloydbacteria bacterium RIFCSPLOWO2_12_FULL_51_9]
MGTVLWLTGLSGSGKTALAEALKKTYEAKGKRVYILDGDAVRQKDARPLGFSREDIRENNRRIALLAKEKKNEHDLIFIPVIAPFAEDRMRSREIIGNSFFEVFVDCPLAECVKRDVKGLYRAALAGNRTPLIGMDGSEVPYEMPTFPDMRVNTGRLTLEESALLVSKFLEKHAIV